MFYLSQELMKQRGTKQKRETKTEREREKKRKAAMSRQELYHAMYDHRDLHPILQPSHIPINPSSLAEEAHHADALTCSHKVMAAVG